MSFTDTSASARAYCSICWRLIVLAIFVAALIERAWDVAITSYVEQIRSNTPLRIPLAWAQLPWFAGIALFGIALALAILRTLVALVRGDYAAAAAISSAVTQDEEIESELEGPRPCQRRQ